jgi:hypothetical protein
MYLYKNYNPNHKWEITTIRTLHDLEDQGVISYNVTYLWHISLTIKYIKRIRAV